MPSVPGYPLLLGNIAALPGFVAEETRGFGCLATTNLLALINRHVRNVSRSDILSARTNEFIAGVLFEDMCSPSADSADCENRRVEIKRNSQHVVSPQFGIDAPAGLILTGIGACTSASGVTTLSLQVSAIEVEIPQVREQRKSKHLAPNERDCLPALQRRVRCNGNRC